MATVTKPRDSASLQKALAIDFRRPALLEQALVHRSYLNEAPELDLESNERMEFLGDAVLGLVISERLYVDYPALSEGHLSQIRALLVRWDTLAEAAERIALGDYLIMGRGEEMSGGRTRPSNLAGGLEALIGAAFLDGGITKAKKLVLKLLGPELEKVAAGAVVGLDVTSRMVTLARTKAAMRSDLPAQPAFLVGDMMALPFADQAFDLVTAGYGLRNAPELAPALHEALRVLRPGGRLLSLDFNRPDHPVVRRVYLTWLTLVGSVLGFLLHRDPDTYRYIPESIRRYPGASQVVQHLQRAGFAEVAWHPVLGGLMAIHTATRPLSGG